MNWHARLLTVSLWVTECDVEKYKWASIYNWVVSMELYMIMPEIANGFTQACSL